MKQISLWKICSKSIYHQVYKVRNDLGPEVMKDIFHFLQKPYNLRN